LLLNFFAHCLQAVNKYLRADDGVDGSAAVRLDDSHDRHIGGSSVLAADRQND